MFSYSIDLVSILLFSISHFLMLMSVTHFTKKTIFYIQNALKTSVVVEK